MAASTPPAQALGMNVDQFKGAFDGGSRPNRFMVSGDIPGPQPGTISSLVVRAASMPAVNVGIMRVPFRGRIVKIPGDRTFDEWTITIYDTFSNGDNNIANLRPLFMAWNNAFNIHESNIPHPLFADAKTGKLDYNTLFADLYVSQISLSGNVMRTVKLVNSWPTVVGELVLNFDSTDTLAEYSVTFAYDYLHDSTVVDDDGATIVTPPKKL